MTWTNYLNIVHLKNIYIFHCCSFKSKMDCLAYVFVCALTLPPTKKNGRCGIHPHPEAAGRLALFKVLGVCFEAKFMGRCLDVDEGSRWISGRSSRLKIWPRRQGVGAWRANFPRYARIPGTSCFQDPTCVQTYKTTCFHDPTYVLAPTTSCFHDLHPDSFKHARK